jgi:hypothetical protein
VGNSRRRTGFFVLVLLVIFAACLFQVGPSNRVRFSIHVMVAIAALAPVGYLLAQWLQSLPSARTPLRGGTIFLLAAIATVAAKLTPSGDLGLLLCCGVMGLVFGGVLFMNGWRGHPPDHTCDRSQR